LKLLLEQGLPRSTVRFLMELGIAAEHVGELGMSRADDADILETARQRDAVVVTLDSDFHMLLAMSRAVVPSVIRIRIEGIKGDEIATILQSVLEHAETEIEAGAVVSPTANRIRVRRLPIGA
jgi:predicted nuclease of predicted toxin-antitoxin system